LWGGGGGGGVPAESPTLGDHRGGPPQRGGGKTTRSFRWFMLTLQTGFCDSRRLTPSDTYAAASARHWRRRPCTAPIHNERISSCLRPRAVKVCHETAAPVAGISCPATTQRHRFIPVILTLIHSSAQVLALIIPRPTTHPLIADRHVPILPRGSPAAPSVRAEPSRAELVIPAVFTRPHARCPALPAGPRQVTSGGCPRPHRRAPGPICSTAAGGKTRGHRHDPAHDEYRPRGFVPRSKLTVSPADRPDLRPRRSYLELIARRV